MSTTFYKWRHYTPFTKITLLFLKTFIFLDINLELGTYNVKFWVTEQNGNIENASVIFNQEEKLTNSQGEAIFTDVPCFSTNLK